MVTIEAAAVIFNSYVDFVMFLRNNNNVNILQRSRRKDAKNYFFLVVMDRRSGAQLTHLPSPLSLSLLLLAILFWFVNQCTHGNVLGSRRH